MSQIDAEENILSETAAEAGEMKLVPVSESIRYRKRAQAAEKKNEVLEEQLTEAREKVSEMSKQLDGVQNERELAGKLAAAGAIDLETAVLVASGRMESSGDADLDDIVEQLKNEKRYLFGTKEGDKIKVSTRKTTGVKDGVQGSQTVLERAAKKASKTGNRTDLQEYLKLRRNFV